MYVLTAILADYQDCGFNVSPPSRGRREGRLHHTRRVKGGYITQMGEYPFTALIGSTDSKGKVSSPLFSPPLLNLSNTVLGVPDLTRRSYNRLTWSPKL